MPLYPESFIQQVAQATDIVDLVSQYVALKKAGREFVGLCPFHEDHKPSMYVSPVKQIFKCFACGAGGGVFQFVMLHERQTFTEAVRTLAEKARIPLPRDTDEPIRPGLEKEDLLAVTAFAAEFFRGQLWSPGAAAALDYARKRGFTDESLKRFAVGYAPDAWEAIQGPARRKGVTTEQLVAAGLVIRREGSAGCYDRFRNRLMFPIYDVAGRPIAFGGRALAADERAKYLNSPDTTLFDKSAELFALNWSREGIAASGTAVVVEGYLDALMPLQAGLNNVVATLGTALTERHVRILSRHAREVVLLFDSDTAGEAAAERALDLFLQQRLHVRVAAVPEGKDPCDFVTARGGQAMKDLVAAAPDALQYVWQRRLAAYRQAGDNLADRRRVVDDFLGKLASSSVYGSIDEVRRGQLAQHIAHMLNISAADLAEQMRRLGRRVPKVSPARPAGTAGESGSFVPGESSTLAQRHVLEVLLNRPDLFDHAAERLTPADFSDDRLRAVAVEVWRLGEAGRLSLDELLPLEPLAELAGLVAELVTSGDRRGNEEATLTGAVNDLGYWRARREQEEMKSAGLSRTDTVARTLEELEGQLKQPDARRRPRIR